MKNLKMKIARWAAALVMMILMVASVVGCGAAEVYEPKMVELATIEETAKAESEAEPETEAEPDTEADVSSIESSEDEEIVSEGAEDEDAVTVEEDGHYTSKEEVALYIHTYGKLPSNYITKNEAEELGWKKKDGEAGQLHVVAPGMSIGGSKYGNYEGLLPDADGRKYYECDINYVKGNRGAERIVYSNDGLIFYTGDHYETFEQLYPAE